MRRLVWVFNTRHCVRCFGCNYSNHPRTWCVTIRPLVNNYPSRQFNNSGFSMGLEFRYRWARISTHIVAQKGKKNCPGRIDTVIEHSWNILFHFCPEEIILINFSALSWSFSMSQCRRTSLFIDINMTCRVLNNCWFITVIRNNYKKIFKLLL